MSSKFFARAFAGNATQAAQAPVRRSLRGVAKAKLRASRAASAAHLAASGALAAPAVPAASALAIARTAGKGAGADVAAHARGLPPGQAGAIVRSVTDGACGCDDTISQKTRPVQPGRVRRLHVWDLPTRLFHWSLVLSVTLALATGLVGGDWMPVHGYAGIAIVGLVAFRLVWGVTGAAHARFVNFAPTPARLRAYLSGRWQGHGHNPLGALSVFALLAMLAVQAATGLVGNDEIAFQGPLATLVAETRSIELTGLHHKLAWVLLGLIALHVLAIAAYLVVRKTNLVKPMVTGWKEVPQAAGQTAAADAADAGAAGLAPDASTDLSGAADAAHAADDVHGAGAWRWTALACAIGVALLAMAFASGAGLAQDVPAPAPPSQGAPAVSPQSGPAPAW